MNFINVIVLPAALEPLALQGNIKLAAAMVFGIMLGFILVKCELVDRVQVKSELTFASMKMCKTLLLALGVGMLAFALLRSVHVVQTQIPPTTFWGTLVGGILVGVGLGIGGLVPVTAVAALGAGRLYAVWFIQGMILAFPAAKFLRDNCKSILDKFSAPVAASLESSQGIWSLESPVLWISAAALILCLLMHLLGSKDSK